MKALLKSKEIWKVYPHNPAYACSNFGKVKTIIPRQGRTLGITAKRKCAGYYHCATVNKYVHQMILETFTTDCPKGMECRHINGNKLDNKISNLVWGTSSENKKDNWKHGRYANRKSSGPLGYKHSLEAKKKMSELAIERYRKIKL